MPVAEFDYDSALKRVFSHPKMIREVVRYLSPQLDDVAMEDLQLTSTEQVSKNLKKRYQDLVWKARRAEAGIAVYLALEFQSKVERFMPLRMNTYCSLLSEQLVRQKRLDPDGRLPSVIPLVIYNGSRRWKAPLDLGDLYSVRGSTKAGYNAECEFILMDLSAFRERALTHLEHPLGLLICLECAETEAEWLQVFDEYEQWYWKSGDDELKEDLAKWLKASIDDSLREKTEGVEDMGMMAENFKKWAANHRAQGIEEGRVQGVEEGRVQGVEEGRVQGLEIGKRDLLFRLIESKYGPAVRGQLNETLMRLTTTEALDRFGDWIIQCETAEELFERIRLSANGITG